MVKRNKLIVKLRNNPKTFTWNELITTLTALGYQEIQGGGSRVKFENGNPDHLINLHKPHPSNEMKQYAIRQVIAKLKEAKLI